MADKRRRSRTGSGPAAWGRRGPRAPGPGRSSRRRLLIGTAWAVVAALLVCGGGLLFLYLKFNGNLRGIDLDARLGGDRPGDVDNGSMDILVLGSDSRSGANEGYGRDKGNARSDTAMVVHVAKGHREATVVSIPRDTLIDRPACTAPDGRVLPPAHRVMFNQSYTVGGPACSVKTVEKLTAIRMDHFIEIDFAGFRELVDALGGVTVTTRRPISDAESHLDLPAGTHHLDGERSLAFVRTRHGIGDGSDLGRIELQQQFLAALSRQVHGLGLFSSPKRLYKVSDAATRSITTDSHINSIGSLMDLAQGLKRIRAKDMNMITMPVAYAPADRNRVVPKEPYAHRVWDALRADRPVPRSATYYAGYGYADQPTARESGSRTPP